MQSIFNDNEAEPSSGELLDALGERIDMWKDLADFCQRRSPGSIAAWHYSGKKFGWSYRISDRKRVLLYLLPRDGFFKAALVFGDRAVNSLLGSNINEQFKTELLNARKHAEGRGIRIEVKDYRHAEDLKMLVAAKIEH